MGIRLTKGIVIRCFGELLHFGSCMFLAVPETGSFGRGVGDREPSIDYGLSPEVGVAAVARIFSQPNCQDTEGDPPSEEEDPVEECHALDGRELMADGVDTPVSKFAFAKDASCSGVSGYCQPEHPEEPCPDQLESYDGCEGTAPDYIYDGNRCYEEKSQDRYAEAERGEGEEEGG